MSDNRKSTIAFSNDPFFSGSQQAAEEEEILDVEELDILDDDIIELDPDGPDMLAEAVLDLDDDEDDGWDEAATQVWDSGYEAPADSGPAAPEFRSDIRSTSGAYSAAGAARGSAAGHAEGAADRTPESANDGFDSERTVITDGAEFAVRAQAISGSHRAAVVPRNSGPVIPVPTARPAGAKRDPLTMAIVAMLAVALLIFAFVAVYIFFPRDAGTAPAATLAIFSDPSGAEILIDGQRFHHDGADIPASTPTTLNGLPVDRDFTLSLRLDGYAEHQAVMRLVPGESARERIEMRPSVATLFINTNPAGATILVNGTSRGTSPVTIEGLDVAASLTIEASREGYEPAERTFRFEESGGAEQRVALTLVPASDPEPEEEEEVEPEPEPARTVARAEPTRTPSTPPVRTAARTEPSPAPTPRTTVREREPEPEPAAQQRRPRVVASSSAGASEPAATGTGSISVQARPYGQVWINNRIVASETPLLNHSLPAGSYRVKVFFVASEQFSEERTIRIAPGENQRVSFTQR